MLRHSKQRDDIIFLKKIHWLLYEKHLGGGCAAVVSVVTGNRPGSPTTMPVRGKAACAGLGMPEAGGAAAF